MCRSRVWPSRPRYWNVIISSVQKARGRRRRVMRMEMAFIAATVVGMVQLVHLDSQGELDAGLILTVGDVGHLAPRVVGATL